MLQGERANLLRQIVRVGLRAAESGKMWPPAPWSWASQCERAADAMQKECHCRHHDLRRVRGRHARLERLLLQEPPYAAPIGRRLCLGYPALHSRALPHADLASLPSTTKLQRLARMLPCHLATYSKYVQVTRGLLFGQRQAGMSQKRRKLTSAPATAPRGCSRSARVHVLLVLRLRRCVAGRGGWQRICRRGRLWDRRQAVIVGIVDLERLSHAARRPQALGTKRWLGRLRRCLVRVAAAPTVHLPLVRLLPCPLYRCATLRVGTSSCSVHSLCCSTSGKTRHAQVPDTARRMRTFQPRCWSGLACGDGKPGGLLGGASAFTATASSAGNASSQWSRLSSPSALGPDPLTSTTGSEAPSGCPC
jgi:hypothetical protein